MRKTEGVRLSPLKRKSRRRGEGSGYIEKRCVTKGSKGSIYDEYHYHYEIWEEGSRVIKSSKYIPKRLVDAVIEMEQAKCPIKEILDYLAKA